MQPFKLLVITDQSFCHIYEVDLNHAVRHSAVLCVDYSLDFTQSLFK